MNNEQKTNNLRICGGEHKVVELDQVKAVTTPPIEYRKELNKNGERSISYHPIPHSELIERTRGHLDQAGFSIEAECHNLARADQRYFGLFQVSHPDRESSDRGTIVGLRNSHDKCFPASLCAGDAPFVCDNLIFTNDVKLARRHTKNIFQELDFVISRTLGKLFNFWVAQDERIEAYKQFDLKNAQVNDIVIRACKAGALPKSKIIDVVDQWEKSDHQEFWDRNMNSLYNSFTEVYKGNLTALPQRSEALHSVLDSEIGFDSSLFQKDEAIEAEIVGAGDPF